MLTSVKDKVVLITGATAGIGESCAHVFAEEGSKVILVGRRQDRLSSLKEELESAYPQCKIHTVSMSVTDLDAVAKLPDHLPEDFNDVDILINNAGCALGVATADTNNIGDAKTMMDTNVVGLIAMTRAFLPGMISRNSGHIINMGSIAGHYAYSNGSMYNASKYAVQGFTDASRHDLKETPIRVTHLSPGLVGNTEFSNVRFYKEGDNKDNLAAKVYKGIVALHPDDVADSALYAATRPMHMQVAELMIYCTNQSGPKDVARVGPNLGAKCPYSS